MRLAALSLLLLLGSAAALRCTPGAAHPARASSTVGDAAPAALGASERLPTTIRSGVAPPLPAGFATAASGALALLTMVEPAAAASDVAWVAPTKFFLGTTFTLGTVAFLMRVVLSWFPKYNLNEPPWNIAAIPTEPILKPTRQLIPPVAGVDISPLVWVGILSFFSEILTGPQGLLTIIEKRGGM